MGLLKVGYRMIKVESVNVASHPHFAAPIVERPALGAGLSGRAIPAGGKTDSINRILGQKRQQEVKSFRTGIFS
jgi:hypothetical protein